MAYLLLRLSLTLFTELFIMRITAHVLTMRSNAQYYRAVLVYYLIWAPLRELALPTAVRVMGMLVYISIPVLCSVGPLPTRITRNLFIQLLVSANEMLTVSLTAAITGGEGTMGSPADRDAIVPIVVAYSILISIYACETEAIFALFSRLDHQQDARVEPPVFIMMLGSLGLIAVIYYRIFGRNDMLTSILTVITVYAILSALLGFALIVVAQRDTRAKRLIANQMAQARQAKHVRNEVVTATRLSLDLRRLRHDLANQLHVVSRLVEAGHYDDADRYLAELQRQAHSLQQSRK